MSTENKELMKLFASMLRKCAKSDTEMLPHVDPSILYFLSRKDIVDIIKGMYQEGIPGKPDLATLENKELLIYIPNDFFIISHILNQWCLEFLRQSHTHQEVVSRNEDVNED